MKGLKSAGIIGICLMLPSIAFSASQAPSSLKQAEPSLDNWGGFYAGVSVGLMKNNLSMTDVNASSFNATIDQITNPKVSAGAQIGVRRQTSLATVTAVYGLEASANFSDQSFSQQYGSPFALYQLQSDHKLRAVYMLQLLGGIAVDRTLLFLAAGGSLSDVSGSVVNTSGLPFFRSFSVTKTSPGVALGAGMEHKYNQNLSLRLKVDVICGNSYTTQDDNGSNYQLSNRTMLASLGVNYKLT